MKIHIVQKGDTLWKIAKKYGVNFEELKKMNSQLSNPDMIMPGMKIKVPTVGGNVKKETPIGTKKEAPIKEQPIVKEAPNLPPVKEAPNMPAPNIPPPKVEQPKKPYIPKMPKPIIPEIDINNYYMMNMAHLNVQQPQQPVKPAEPIKPIKPTKPVEQVKPIEPFKPVKPLKPLYEQPVEQMPQLPPKPKNILPEMKPYTPVEQSMEETTTLKGGYKQPMHNMQPAMPEAFPQMQGQVANPMYYGGLPGVEGAHYQSDDESPFMPQMPNMSPVAGASEFGNTQLQPNMPMMEHMQMAPAMQQYPCPPYPTHMYPISPVLPGPGPLPAYDQGYQMMPQVQGVANQFEEPYMAGNQAPMPNYPPFQSMHGGGNDCGCGGQQPMGMHHQPMMMPYGAGGGFDPNMQGGFNPSMYSGGFDPSMQGGFNPGMYGGGFDPSMQGGFNPSMYGGGFDPGMQGGFNPGMYGGGFDPSMQGGFNPGMYGGGFDPSMQGGFMPETYDQFNQSMNPSMYGGFNQGGRDEHDPNMYSGFNQESPEDYDVNVPNWDRSGVAPVYVPPYSQQLPVPPYMNPYGPMGARFGMPRNNNGNNE